jgi:hypothetical protein
MTVFAFSRNLLCGEIRIAAENLSVQMLLRVAKVNVDSHAMSAEFCQKAAREDQSIQMPPRESF